MLAVSASREDISALCQALLDGCSATGYCSVRMTLPKVSRAVSSFPVGAAEIAKRLGVRPQTVHAWRHRKRMPEPHWTVSGQPAWDWAEVESWAKRTGRLREHDIHADMLELEGAGWKGDLEAMRRGRAVSR